jgi:IS4 transposase
MKNEVIAILSNDLECSARTIAGLDKKRWDLKSFLKSMKQNLQIKNS